MSDIPEGATHISVRWGEHYKMGDDGGWLYFNTNSNSWLRSTYKMIEGIRPLARIAAHEFLERGVSHMRDRAVQRDSEAGERSMARAVAAFNAQEGTNLTEAQGWRFMIQLKYARAVNGVFVADDYEDMAAYAGLAGEAAQ